MIYCTHGSPPSVEQFFASVIALRCMTPIGAGPNATSRCGASSTLNFHSIPSLPVSCRDTLGPDECKADSLLPCTIMSSGLSTRVSEGGRRCIFRPHSWRRVFGVSLVAFSPAPHEGAAQTTAAFESTSPAMPMITVARPSPSYCWRRASR